MLFDVSVFNQRHDLSEISAAGFHSLMLKAFGFP